MIRLSLCIVPSRVNSDGTHTIRLRISINRTIAYIPTKYSVHSASEWNGHSVVKHSNAIAINRKLRNLLTEHEELIESLPETSLMTASEVKNWMMRRSQAESLVAYCDLYIADLKSNNQTSYATNMGYTRRYLHECFGNTMTLQLFNYASVKQFEKFLFNKGSSSTTVNIRMTHLKALLNAAVNEGLVEYKIFPFRQYKMPRKEIRDICISKEEFIKLRDASFSGCAARRLTLARDLFMLSFYCAGINLTDIVDANLNEDVLTFVRKKTAEKKQGEKKISITIQNEARAIIQKYINADGKLDFGYHYSDYAQFRSFITKSLNRIGEMLSFEKKLMFYSARKTFCQFGYELGVPLYILEYAIGQTIKDASSRPIFDYINIMRKQADAAIRRIIDYSMS